MAHLDLSDREEQLVEAVRKGTAAKDYRSTHRRFGAVLAATAAGIAAREQEDDHVTPAFQAAIPYS
ncbi:hypothetical protein E4U56_005966 [Claviceps arundinis]|uniref:Uncharacterized protein n=1 Tax=Claviceps arundinis TaxID=1623583 RepID=A0A9P7MWI1_9HYPO|nr:hypothetical protein E4U56_005966 [Claviceps arundinis]